MRCTARMRMAVAGLIFLVLVVFLTVGRAAGQQATVSTPYHSLGDSFFENIGTSWGLRGKGFNMQFGSPTMAAPPFGRFNPGAGASVGGSFQTGSVSGFFNGNFSQGFQQGFVTQAPCITVTNGIPGYFATGVVTPFVLSYVPVVGGFPVMPMMFAPMPAPMPVMSPMPSGIGAGAVRQALRQARTPRDHVPADPAPDDSTRSEPCADTPDSPARRLALAQQSTAGQAVPSVQEANRLRVAEEASHQAEARVFYERGISAEEAGRLGAATAYYHIAARRASGDLKREILQRIQAMKTASKAVAE